MSELLALKQRLKEQLDIIEKAIKIQSEYTETSRNGFSKPVTLDTEKIEEIIMEIEGDFDANDVRALIKKKFDTRASYGKSSINTALYRLVSGKKLEYARVRSGRKPAIYHKP